MLKWLLFAVLIFAIYYFFFRIPKNKTKQNKDESIMFPCDKCGTYVSGDTCIIKDGKYYCSKECATLKA